MSHGTGRIVRGNRIRCIAMGQILKSKSLELRVLSQDDYDSLRRINPCDEYYLMVGSSSVESIFENDEKFETAFSELLGKENHWQVYRDSEIIGIAFLHSIDLNDKRARYAVGIYNKKNWNKGYGQEISDTVLNYSFKTLDLHRIDLRVLAYNKRAIASYQKSGFVQEGVLRENAFINSVWHDDIVMSILSHEYSTFNVKQGKI